MKLKFNIFLVSTNDTFEKYQPELPHNFRIQIDLRIGFDDEEGMSNYFFSVCTPTWLDHNIQNQGPISGRHLLIVNRYDHKEIAKYVENIIVACMRPSREDTFVVLSRYFFWEFEDYQP